MRYWQTDRHLMSDKDRLHAAIRLITAAGGSLDDQHIVADAGVGYASGEGSSGMSDVWVTGNWNDESHYANGQRIVTSTMPARLFDALERLGVSGEWSDEWTRCDNCQRLIRTQPDSYGWTPQFIAGEDGYLCHECAIDSLPDTLEPYVNDDHRAVTWLSAEQLAEHGWRDGLPDDRDAACGLHPGQDDKPAELVARLRESGDDRDYLFVITDKGQFDVHYRIMVRDNDEGNDEE